MKALHVKYENYIHKKHTFLNHFAKIKIKKGFATYKYEKKTGSVFLSHTQISERSF